MTGTTGSHKEYVEREAMRKNYLILMKKIIEEIAGFTSKSENDQIGRI